MAEIAALFTPANLITSATFAKAALKEQSRYRSLTAAIFAQGRTDANRDTRPRDWVSAVQDSIAGGREGNPSLLSFRVSPDTTIARISLNPYSKTPANEPLTAASLGDYTLLVKGLRRVLRLC